MLIHHISDLHIEFMHNKAGMITHDSQAILDRIATTESDVLVLAGDTQVKGRTIKWASMLAEGRPVVVVAGNHEFYGSSISSTIHDLRQEAKKYPNVHFLEREAVEIDGVVFLGCTLWTNMQLFSRGPFSGLYGHQETLEDCQKGMTDFSSIKRPGGAATLTPQDSVQIWQKSVRWLHEQFQRHAGKKIVVVTHHAPSARSVHESYHQDIISAAYASHLDRMIELHRPALWIHGHVHWICDYMVGHTRVMANCRGYDNHLADAMGFDPSLVVDV